jgi:hypothetical protein
MNSKEIHYNFMINKIIWFKQKLKMRVKEDELRDLSYPAIVSMYNHYLFIFDDSEKTY